MTIRLKHLVEDIDRHGNVRRYVRVPGRLKVRLTGVPGTEEFMAAYHAAIAGAQEASQAREARRGSFRHHCILFYASTAFTQLDRGTQSWMRYHLDRLSQSYAALPVAMLKQKHVRKMRDELEGHASGVQEPIKGTTEAVPLGCRGRGSSSRSYFGRKADGLRHEGAPFVGVVRGRSV